ncbi:hypothetical protein A7K91_12510 [Paenibacillus oryzae]|uniref:ABC transporter permease n=1 Tax=Paenibacillus oryzae TaxID=1844972 RepID=A0A1A5YFC5_9BACL|nr:ABC transporter permease [Paenibacillus oryzae]OBR64331.1 hypothetical protein A7K91_12510 [Paenibacillus oryzae]
MFDFMNLVRNENMKIYRRPRTYVMGGLLAGLVLIASLIWLAVSGRDTSMWDVAFFESMLMSGLVTIFVVIVAAASVAEEFSGGTIKLLLIRPWSRSKILLSKYIAVFLYALLMSVVLFASVLLINWLIFGIGNTGIEAAMMPAEAGSGVFVHILKFYGLKFIETIMTLTIAFMLSSMFRSSVLAVGIALFQILIVNNIASLIMFLKQKWVDYVLFIHLDLTQYLSGSGMGIRPGMTLGFSLGVLAVYYVLFMALAWLVFTKRDVAN